MLCAAVGLGGYSSLDLWRVARRKARCLRPLPDDTDTLPFAIHTIAPGSLKIRTRILAASTSGRLPRARFGAQSCS
jgi:hypothetical protein